MLQAAAEQWKSGQRPHLLGSKSREPHISYPHMRKDHSMLTHYVVYVHIVAAHKVCIRSALLKQCPKQESHPAWSVRQVISQKVVYHGQTTPNHTTPRHTNYLNPDSTAQRHEVELQHFPDDRSTVYCSAATSTAIGSNLR